ncbi:MAG: DUF3450 family protein [Deltaproteobacteria bacterium]|nr:DUF3450 family protein [Deltaproteobacteria bacterium]
MPLLLILSGLAVAEPDLSSMAEELTALRLQVERADSELSALRARTESEARSLLDQRAELDVLLQREALRLQVTQELSAKASAEATQANQERSALTPVLLSNLATLRAQTEAGLPYQVDGRVEVIDALRAGLEAGTLDPRQATTRLWQHLEDELKLAEDSGMSRQVVEWPEGRVLSKVAHLGLVEAYCQAEAPAGPRYGHARQVDGAWTFVPLEGDASRAVADLFSSFERSIHSGPFTLPLRQVQR